MCISDLKGPQEALLAPLEGVVCGECWGTYDNIRSGLALSQMKSAYLKLCKFVRLATSIFRIDQLGEEKFTEFRVLERDGAEDMRLANPRPLQCSDEAA